MSVSSEHKSRKLDSYWQDLTYGTTAEYKKSVIADYLATHFKGPCDSILDVGCGSSEIARQARDTYDAKRLVLMDYDAEVIKRLSSKEIDKSIEWLVADIFELGSFDETFDLVFFLDMLHEVYSFCGRYGGDLSQPIDHEIGVAKVCDALGIVSRLVRPGGGIVITDNVLTPERLKVRIIVRNIAARDAVRRFLAEYPSKVVSVRWLGDMEFLIDSWDLCILLTQYNKIKSGDEQRWNVEKMEIHQYFTLNGYREIFQSLGFDLFARVETPAINLREWQEDFSVVGGLVRLPEKRISLLAIKRV